MSNHVHLIIRSSNVRISTLMARLCTGYALYFTKRYDWKGHVFQNRFGSSRIGDDAYLRAAIAYVHRNPVDAGMVSLEELSTYRWTSHSAVLGMRPPRRFESVQETLAVFGGDLRALVEAVARGGPLPVDLQWRRLPRRTPTPAAPSSSAQSFEALLAAICETHCVHPSRLLCGERSRPVAAARREIAWRAIRELGLTQASVAKRLRVSSAAMTQLVARARRRVS
jgi:hypothetical protein